MRFDLRIRANQLQDALSARIRFNTIACNDVAAPRIAADARVKLSALRAAVAEVKSACAGSDERKIDRAFHALEVAVNNASRKMAR